MCVLQCVFPHIPRRALTPSVFPLSSDLQIKTFIPTWQGFSCIANFKGAHAQTLCSLYKPDHDSNYRTHFTQCIKICQRKLLLWKCSQLWLTQRWIDQGDWLQKLISTCYSRLCNKIILSTKTSAILQNKKVWASYAEQHPWVQVLN